MNPHKFFIVTMVATSSLLYAFWLGGTTVSVSNDTGARDDNEWHQPAQQVFISGGRGTAWGRWLTIIRDPASKEYGFLPETTMVVSKYKPVVKQLKKGYWGISFTP